MQPYSVQQSNAYCCTACNRVMRAVVQRAAKLCVQSYSVQQGNACSCSAYSRAPRAVVHRSVRHCAHSGTAYSRLAPRLANCNTIPSQPQMCVKLVAYATVAYATVAYATVAYATVAFSH